MKSDILFFIELVLSFLPFVLFAFFNAKANVKREVRHRQYVMPAVAVVYSIVLLIFLDKLSELCNKLFLAIAVLFGKIGLQSVGNALNKFYSSWGMYLTIVLFNTLSLLLYIIIKRIITAILNKTKVNGDSFVGSVVSLFYSYDEMDDRWYIKEHYGQACTFLKATYYGSCFVSGLALLISCGLCMNRLVSAPFYPVFAVIIIGELAFFIDGCEGKEHHSDMSVSTDKSKRIAMYPLLRKPLRALFGDKLSAEGTTVNNGGSVGGAIEDILVGLEQEGGHIGINYAKFIRSKMRSGLKPNIDYVRCGYELAAGKSLLFNTPFYDKLNPYVFYAINRELLTGGKVLIVLGRHGTEEDLLQWSEAGMREVTNVPGLWDISVLSDKKSEGERLPDIGIISRSGVHDLDIHKNNLEFLGKVSFVMIVEPSRLVTTAQIGLNLLIKCCGKERAITFCSVDRNCDGLVDAMSHILMANITEVSATEYPHGMSSYMYWTADDDYLQHRILPGVSRFMGMGTELSMVALKNQVKKTVWYGGDSFPVKDAHWIAKQYYYNLLDYAQLPTNQETFDKSFQTSFNMCDERVSDYSFITVEDDRNNLFETRRNFATIAEEQGFVNVISSEYMLREYMSSNPEVFTADAKAIPYITADYARTKRNAILSLCLLMCIDSVQKDVLDRQMIMLNIETDDPRTEIWKEVCVIFGSHPTTDGRENQILSVVTRDGKTVSFEKDKTILYKREYSVESGKFESVYTIEDADFSRIILDDLQNASYIAEKESDDVYIGTELKGHVYQKYMPGQFFTLNGKYYEMISTAVDNRILVRRASEHIGGRLSYRQVRNYKFSHLEDSLTMGALKSVNNIDIHYQYADFSVETPGYWKLRAHNDFDNGDLVTVNGVPVREYHHKQILKFDFSKLGDAFTDSVRMTLTNLLNETFVTLFADNQPFISAITLGEYDAPLTYSLAADEGVALSDKCIFIVEDSQLDIGLLVAVERNANRIFQVIADYLAWNDEQLEESLKQPEGAVKEAEEPVTEEVQEEETPQPEKKGFFRRICDWVKGIFKKKPKEETEVPAESEGEASEETSEVAEESAEEPREETAEAEGEESQEETAEAESGEPQEEPTEAEGEEPQEETAEAEGEESQEETAEAESGEPQEETAEAESGEPQEETTEAEGEEPQQETVEEEALTPREQKKAAKAAAKAEKKALKEQKKAAKLEQKAARKAEKLLEKQRKAEEKALARQKKTPVEAVSEQPTENIAEQEEAPAEPAEVQSEVEVSENE